MGIVEALPGVKVSIVVNGSALHEYEDPDIEDTSTTVTRYVEAVSNETFEVRILVPSGTQFQGNVLSFHVFADGTLMSRRMVEPKLNKPPGRRKTVKGWRDDKGMLERFRFNELQKDEESHESDVSKLRELGTIKVNCYHKWKGEVVLGYDPGRAAGSSLAVTSVSEKAIKGQAISPSIGLSEAVQDVKSSKYSNTCVDPSGVPCATYQFRYRSRDALKAMLLIPRTPSPEPEAAPTTPEDRKVIPLTDDGPNELRSRAKEAKEERDQKIEQDPRPRSPKRRKTRRSNGMTTIELDDHGEVLRETTIFTTPDADSAIELED